MAQRRVAGMLVVLAGALGVVGCASGPRDPMENLAQGRAEAPAGPRTGGSSASGRVGEGELRPAVVVNGRPVAWEDVWEPMAEHSGGTVVSEVVLDSILAQEMVDRGVTIGASEVEAERAALTRTIVEGVGVGDQQAQQLAREVMLARGLGPHRMDRLLRRNAMLRVLARESVVVDEATLRRAYEVEHGRRYVTRVITVGTSREASEVWSQLAAGPSDTLRSRFAEAAVARSTDPTGGAGGLIGAISPSDTSLPGPLREAVASTPAGSMGPVMAFDNSFAIAMVESVMEPTGVAFESVRPGLEVTVRDRLERLQMDVIAREMLASARVSVFDRSLNWGWESGRPR